MTSGANAEVAHHEVVVIGSGPSGDTAAIYLARAGLSPVVIAGAVTAGGALMTTTEVENFPGFPAGVQGPQLMEDMQAQAEKFGASYLYDDAVAVDLTGATKTITCGSGEQLSATAVVLAMGSGYRQLGVPGEQELTGHGVSWCATCDGFFFRDQDVAVIGGGDSAVEEATFLTRFARTVTLVHRRGQLRASKIMAERAHANPKIRFAWDSEVEHVLAEDTTASNTGSNTSGKVSGLRLRDTSTGALRDLDVTGVFIAIGHDPRSQILRGQVRLDAEGYVLVDHPTTRTDVPGVFACGDLVDRRYRQAITAAGTGCAAALDAERYLEGLADAARTADPVQAALI